MKTQEKNRHMRYFKAAALSILLIAVMIGILKEWYMLVTQHEKTISEWPNVSGTVVSTDRGTIRGLKIMNDETRNSFNELVDCLQVVASDAEEQISVYTLDCCIPDEIAFDYTCNVSRFMNMCEGKQFITEEQAQTIQQLFSMFNKIIDEHYGSEEHCSCDALRNDPEWEQTRVIARDLLKSLGIKKVHPKVMLT